MGQKHGRYSKPKEKGSIHLKHSDREEDCKFFRQRKLKIKRYKRYKAIVWI